MKGLCLSSIVWSAVGLEIRIPLLPISSIPATMEFAAARAIEGFAG
jgi:hypothetical protein